MEPDIDASGFRISWAMPAAISPTAARRDCSCASRSRRFTSVRSWKVTRKPARAIRGVDVRGAEADVDGAAVAATGTCVRGGGRRPCPRPRVERLGQLGRQAAGRRRPAGRRRCWPACRQMRSAAWLKVSTRCDGSVVTSPLGRLSMTFWFSACRSASSLDARSRRAPADRALSAIDPLSRATAKKPNRFSRTTYCAAAACGSDRRVRDQPEVGSDRRRQVLRQHDPDVEHARQRRHHHAAAPELDDAAGDDRQRVERREEAGDAAGEEDERRHHHGVARQLRIDQPALALDVAQARCPHDRQDVDERDQPEEGIRPQRSPAP